MSKPLGFTHDDMKNLSMEWYTPSWVFQELGLHFTLDPCAPVGGVPWIPVTMSYCESDNGLVLPWMGLVWLNPPYGKYTGVWLEKMHLHRNGIALVFARTDNAWFHDYVAKADALLFLRGRIQFVDGLGKTEGGGAGAGSVLIAWGVESVEALRRMSSRGLFVSLPS